MRLKALGGAHLSSLSERESRAHQLVPASDHSAWTVPLVSFDPASSDQRDGARESAHHTRARPQGSRGGRGRSTSTGTPNDRAPRAGSSSGEPVLPCRGRLARRGHHLAPRPALGCATGAATNRAGGR